MSNYSLRNCLVTHPHTPTRNTNWICFHGVGFSWIAVPCALSSALILISKLYKITQGEGNASRADFRHPISTELSVKQQRKALQQMAVMVSSSGPHADGTRVLWNCFYEAINCNFWRALIVRAE